MVIPVGALGVVTIATLRVAEIPVDAPGGT
jgi:hypothetical protein